MRLLLENVGKVKRVEIEAKGITVIAGCNDTGKSTILKSFDAVMRTFCNLDANIKSERRRSVFMQIYRLDKYFDENGFQDVPFDLLPDLAKMVRNDMGRRESVQIEWERFYQVYQKVVMDYQFEIGNDDLLQKLIAEEFVRGIYNKLEKVFHREESEYIWYLAETNLRREFDMQAANLINGGESGIELQSDKVRCGFRFADNRILELTEAKLGRTQIIYIGSGHMLDNLGKRSGVNAEIRLERLLKRERILDQKESSLEQYNETEENLAALEDIFREVTHGRLLCDPDSIRYKETSIDEPIHMKNVASGLKIFLTIKRLVENGSLKADDWILIDEPETNLHPEWHLKFAEILILLKERMNLNIMVSSHSPYFIRALEIKTADYGVKEYGSFYLMKADGNAFAAEDVTECTDKIYKQMYRPLELL